MVLWCENMQLSTDSSVIVTVSFFNALPSPSALLLALAGILMLGGCAESGPDSSPERLTYTLGEALSDSSVALVVRSPYGVDTLRTEPYRRQLKTLRREAEETKGRLADTTLNRTAVRRYVTRHVMLGEAQRRGIAVDSGKLDRRMERLERQYENERAFRRALEEQGLTRDSIRRREANELRLKTLEEQLAGRAEVPTESEIQDYRRDHRQPEVRLRYIFFDRPRDASLQQRDSVQAHAEAVLDSLQSGASFGDLARRHSDSPTATIGGKTPKYKPQEQFEGALGEAVSALQDSGELVQAPVQGDEGVYIVQLEDRRLSPLMERGEARWKLLTRRRRDSVQAGKRALLEKATVRENPKIVSLSFRPDDSG